MSALSAFKRRHVEDAHFVWKRAVRLAFADQVVDGDKERCERLAGAGRRGDQRVTSVADGGPASSAPASAHRASRETSGKRVDGNQEETSTEPGQSDHTAQRFEGATVRGCEGSGSRVRRFEGSRVRVRGLPPSRSATTAEPTAVVAVAAAEPRSRCREAAGWHRVTSRE